VFSCYIIRSPTPLWDSLLLVGDNVEKKIKSCEGETYVVVVSAGPPGGKPGVQSCSIPPPM
jgi:hypothetical protein